MKYFPCSPRLEIIISNGVHQPVPPFWRAIAVPYEFTYGSGLSVEGLCAHRIASGGNMSVAIISFTNSLDIQFMRMPVHCEGYHTHIIERIQAGLPPPTIIAYCHNGGTSAIILSAEV